MATVWLIKTKWPRSFKPFTTCLAPAPRNLLISWGTRQEHFFTYGRKWRWSSDRRRIPKGLSPGWWALQNVGAECGPIIIACSGLFHQTTTTKKASLLLYSYTFFLLFPSSLPVKKKLWKHITNSVIFEHKSFCFIFSYFSNICKWCFLVIFDYFFKFLGRFSAFRFVYKQTKKEKF